MAAPFLPMAALFLAACHQSPTAAVECRPEQDRDLCASTGAVCGSILARDGCLGMRRVDCGACASPAVCTPDHRCACSDPDAALCSREHRQCGSFQTTDACGLRRTVGCGGCPAGAICGGDGVPNRCSSCAPEPDSALCARVGAACGRVDAVDNCGFSRVARCGGCLPGQLCGAELPNQCAAQMCEEDGFCWLNPLPQGNTLRTAFALSDRDVWVGGDGGTLLHWDGARWRKTASGTRSTINAIWAAATNDVWAFGNSAAILHWDGARWTAMAAPTDADLYGVWALGPNEIRVAAAPRGRWVPGELLKWDGTHWALEHTIHDVGIQPRAVWGSSADDIWVAGGYLEPEIEHWDGSSWQLVDLGSSLCSRLMGIVPGDGDEAWAWGGRCVTHFDGTQWSPPLQILGQYESIDAAVHAGGSALLLSTSNGVLRWDGGLLEPRTSPSFVANAFARSPSGKLVAAGYLGGLASFDGMRWTEFGSRIDAQLQSLNGLWGSGLGDLVIVGNTGSTSALHGRVLRWDGASLFVQDGGTMDPLTSVAGTKRDDVWAGAYQWNGSSWVRRGEAHDRLTAAGDGVLIGLRGNTLEWWDGATWTPFPIQPYRPSGAFALSRDDVWAITRPYDSTQLLHWDGDAWSEKPAPKVTLRSLWGSSTSDVWAVGSPMQVDGVGDAGLLVHWQGDAWTAWGTTPRPVVGICGRGRDDVWAVGSEIAHWDGAAWAHRSEGAALDRCWVAPDGEVWAIGVRGEILRRAAP